jgi:uncharacterized membrane protein YhhN
MKRYVSLLLPLILLVCYLIEPRYAVRFWITVSCIPIVGWYGRYQPLRKDTAVIILAFLFSILGDWMLHASTAGNSYFIYGVLFFFIAHIFYILFCLRHGSIAKAFALNITICFLAYYLMALLPNIPQTAIRIAVLLYILVSCLSLSAAKGLRLQPTAKYLFFAGIICLVFSDTLISLHNYLHISTLYFSMLPTYYASQILVSASIISLSKHLHQTQIAS